MKIRIKFAKYGSMKFIGHLDVMRYFQKAIRRADIDIKYSEGFSPHQIMSFASPLSVGVESTGEYLDIEVNTLSSTKDVKEALNGVMVEGIHILSVKILPDSVKNAMASVAAARYQISFPKTKTGKDYPIDNMAQQLADFYAQEKIPVTKITKKNVIEIDLKPAIYELQTESVVNPWQAGNRVMPVLSMLVNASSSGNIKPTMVLEAFFNYCHVPLAPFSYQIARIETYTDLAKEGGPMDLAPLESIGYD